MKPVIVEYNPAWPLEFLEIGRRLRRELGSRALRIDHIGSTAVPGLAAKDVIDVQVTTVALEEPIREALLRLGYIFKGSRVDAVPPGMDASKALWTKWLAVAPPDQRREHIHVRIEGNPNQRFPLLFRDYLRAHPATARAYEQLKRNLADGLADPETYPEVKDPAVQLIILPAEEWAGRTGWSPGPSGA